MLDFSKDEIEEKRFIVDLQVVDENIIITYADGRVHKFNYSLHNLNFYRLQMEYQVRKNIKYALDFIAKDSFNVYLKKIMAIVSGIIGAIIVYNIDIHIIMKIIIFLLMLIGEGIYYIYNELYLNRLHKYLVEVQALEYFCKNIDKFKYYDRETGEVGYIVPIEDVSNYELSVGELEQMAEAIEEFRNKGVDNRDIKLKYRKSKSEDVI